MDTLDNKVVWITGAASGLGAALTASLLEAGALVAMSDLQTDKLQAFQNIMDPQGDRTLSLAMDIGDEDAASHAAMAITDRFGRLDALINNAGTDVTAPIEEISHAQWGRVISTNLSAPFLLSKLALPALTASRGQIINIASTAARRAWPNASAYHASKWGLVGLSHALHAELRPRGVRVTAVILGGMKTPFLLDRFEGLDLNKLQDPADVAEVIRFVLTMPEASATP